MTPQPESITSLLAQFETCRAELNRVKKALRKIDSPLDPTWAVILLYIYLASGKTTQAHITNKFHLSNPSYMISNLRERGFLTFTINEIDCRTQNPRLTEKGERLCRQLVSELGK